jgi:hypothetical protein
MLAVMPKYASVCSEYIRASCLVEIAVTIVVCYRLLCIGISDAQPATQKHNSYTEMNYNYAKTETNRPAFC